MIFSAASNILARAIKLRSRDSYWTAGHCYSASSEILKIINSELIVLKCYSSILAMM